jgi:hypothetical protein
MASHWRMTVDAAKFNREKLPPFDTLWIDCIQKESRIEYRNGKQRGSDDET